MSRKWMKYMMLVMLAACAISVSNAQQKQSANRPISAVFDVGAAKASQSKLAKVSSGWQIMQRCKLDVLQGGSSETQARDYAAPGCCTHRTCCVRRVVHTPIAARGQPGYYIYGNIQDSCAITGDRRGMPIRTSCLLPIRYYTSAALEGATSGYGVCNFTWDG